MSKQIQDLAIRVLRPRSPWHVSVAINEETRDGARVVVATAFASENSSPNPLAPGVYAKREAAAPIEYFGGRHGPLQDAQARALEALGAKLAAELEALGGVSP